MDPQTQPRCTVIISPRDRFSSLKKCLTNVLAQTPGPIDVILVLGGAPKKLRESLENEFYDRVKFILLDRFLNGPEARNIGLREARTALAACIDSDVFVRPGWLEPMIETHRQTGAALISPVVLDRQNLIHTAGNSLFITESGGKKCGSAELHYANLKYAGPTNIPRREMDYAEIHCHFVDVRKALDLRIYDEHFREGADFDSGMTLRKHGEKVVLEPVSSVYLYYPPVLNDLVDRELYLWKWDLAVILENFRYFEEKWGIDMVKLSNMENHIRMLNSRVGACTRLVAHPLAIRADLGLNRIGQALSQIRSSVRKLKDRVIK